MSPDDARIAGEIRALLTARAPTASVCPSEVARALWCEADWRDAMPDVRRVAGGLARSGDVTITQGDARLDPTTQWNGPIRLRRGPRWQADPSKD